MSISSSSVSVSQLVRRIKSALEIQVGELWVEGEISNFKLQSSGHSYFTLKDESAQISCVFFRGALMKSSVRPDNGIKVRLYAEVSVYEPRGQVQLIVKAMEEAGKGSLQQQFEALKKKLMEEGLFDSERKKGIPPFPSSIGIITSPTGAVIQDIQHVFERRAPWIQLYLYPVRVQGDAAAAEIAQAVRLWNGKDSPLPPVDLLIAGRGGGSLEDLWCFNEEIVVRAIADSELPVISAVGHETDFTIADFVADLRAPTPTAAAELASPDGPAISRQLNVRWQQARNALTNILRECSLRLNVYSHGILSSSPDKVLRDFVQLIDETESRMLYSIEDIVRNQNTSLRHIYLKLKTANPERLREWCEQKTTQTHEKLFSSVRQTILNAQTKVQETAKLLTALGPESAFKRGYSILKNDQGLIIRNPDSVESGDSLTVTLEKGILNVTAD